MPTGIAKNPELKSLRIGLACRGKKLSADHKRKISNALKGRKPYKMSDGTRKKLSEALKGRVFLHMSLSKGKRKCYKNPELRLKRISEALTGRKLSEEHCIAISMGNVGKNVGHPVTEETRRKIGLGNSIALKGRKMPLEVREKISRSLKGEKSPLWRGGISLYGEDFNRELKEQIRDRDNHQCQECGYSEDQLEYKLGVHHIGYDKRNNFSSNLISLCKSCHGKTSFNQNDWMTYYSKKLSKNLGLESRVEYMPKRLTPQKREGF